MAISETRSTLSRIDYATYFAARNRGMNPAQASRQATRVCVAFIENEIKRFGASHVYLAHGIQTSA